VVQGVGPEFKPQYCKTNKQINSKQIKELDLKHLKENIGRNLHDIGFSNDFFIMTLKAQAVK
jgi:hypothetical protein